MTYKFLSHTADIKISVDASTLEKAFIDSAMALQESILGRKTKIKSLKQKQIEIRGHDLERLLYDFLEEFIYLIEAKDFILSKIKELKIIKNENHFQLIAMLSGDNSTSYKFSNNVKAITYNDMKIKKNKNKVTIEFVIDV